ncbi:MAG: diaminopimelate decarboxylase [Dehalococcoidales bacterium]|jgi:diaminopimelate decarboxylase|nr:diaminopimelate decarboxylase [Dehalococcoidales bacterium]
MVTKVAKLNLFPLTAEVNDQGHLVIGGCDTVELAAEFDTPLYVFDEFSLRSKCHEFKTEFGQRYPETMLVYASKVFLNRALAIILKEEGLGLDVVSAGELAIARSVDFPMDMVYFHGNNKSAEELELALEYHVGRIVVDNFDELSRLGEIAEETGHIPDILLRLTPGVDPHTHEHITTGIIGGKFGFPLFSADKAIAKAMLTPSLNLVGLHFHLGSLIFEAQPYHDAIEIMLECAAEMKQKHGFELKELNIGGGFAIQYTLDHPAPAISVYAEVIVSKLLSKCRELKLTSPMLTLEPGRAIVGQAGIALYRAGVVKDIPGIKCYVSVDGGMADNIRPALYGAKYEALVANKVLKKEAGQVTIAGKFCESGDILVKDISLPQISTGDIIAIPDCGAYCLPLQSNYNASLKPAIALVKEGKVRLIRRRETFDDLIGCDLL